MHGGESFESVVSCSHLVVNYLLLLLLLLRSGVSPGCLFCSRVGGHVSAGLRSACLLSESCFHVNTQTVK